MMMATYRQSAKASKDLLKLGIEHFIPIRGRKKGLKGAFVMDCSNVFVRCEYDTINKILKECHYLRVRTEHNGGSLKPITLSDKDMKAFIKENRTNCKRVI